MQFKNFKFRTEVTVYRNKPRVVNDLKNEEQGKSEQLLIAVLDYIYSSLVGIFIFNFVIDIKLFFAASLTF